MSVRSIVLLSVISVLLVACGGSSSETPWPVEPQGAALGPAGESGDPSADDPAVTNEREDSEATGEAAKPSEGKKVADPQRMRP